MPQDTGPQGDAAARAARWLRAWDAQGWHRTATAGDDTAADWLADQVAALGFTPRFEDVPIQRYDPLEAWLEVDGTRIDGVSMFDAPDTPPDGLAGQIGEGRPIGLLERSPRDIYRPDFRRMRQASPHQALALVTIGPRPGLALLNAEGFSAPYGPPVLQIASIHRDTLRDAVARGAHLRLVTRSRRTPATARNVTLEIAGTDRRAPKLVVMTPRSAWFVCTSERGGGLVCWLESLRAMRNAQPARDVIFTANTGHELNHLGLDAFVAARPGCEPAWEWIHYGANIGAAGGELQIFSADPPLAVQTAAVLHRVGLPPDRIVPPDQVPSGETRDIHLKGGRYVTLVGTNPLFHMEADRWPDSVSLDAVVRAAHAAAGLVRQCAGLPLDPANAPGND